MATSSARYVDLYEYARTAEQIDHELIGQADRLINRLSYFEATCRESGFQVSSDGLGSALRSYATRNLPVDRRVREIGEAFQRADGQSGSFLRRVQWPFFMWPIWRLLRPNPTTVPDTDLGSDPTYVVKPGDTLGDIARRYGVTVPDLSLLNGIRDPNLIHPGQVLILPGAPAMRTPRPVPVPGPTPRPAPQPPVLVDIIKDKQRWLGEKVDRLRDWIGGWFGRPITSDTSQSSGSEDISTSLVKVPLIDTTDKAGKYHFNQYEEWYNYWKDYALKENKLGDIQSNADCGPASLIMALEILGLKIGKQHQTKPRGQALALMRPIMVTDDPYHDGLSDAGDFALGEHKGFGAYTNWADIERGAVSSGATFERLRVDDSRLLEATNAVEAALRSGGIVIVSGTFLNKNPLPWKGNRKDKDDQKAPGGAGDHIIAVVGITEDGRFIINDPARNPPPFTVSPAELAYFMSGNSGAAKLGKLEN